MKEYLCVQCGKQAPEYHNFCSWDCQIEQAKQMGGKVYCPNGLPIVAIKADGTMLENGHGDHPTYIFPVTVEYCGPIPADATEEDLLYDYGGEEHALIYYDGSIALTIYETERFLWSLKDGRYLGGHSDYHKGKYRLTEQARLKIHNKMLTEKKNYHE